MPLELTRTRASTAVASVSLREPTSSAHVLSVVRTLTGTSFPFARHLIRPHHRTTPRHSRPLAAGTFGVPGAATCTFRTNAQRVGQEPFGTSATRQAARRYAYPVRFIRVP